MTERNDDKLNIEEIKKLLRDIIEVNNDKDSDFHPAINVWARKAKEMLSDSE